MRRNGIFYGWFIVAASFFALFVSTGARNGFGVFVVPLEQEFGWSRSSLSIAVAIGILVNGISQPFIGRIYDRYGGRLVISFSLFALGIGTMSLSLTNSIWFLIIVYGFVMSIATGGTSLVTVHAVLMKWFYKKRGIVLSIGTAGASAGSLVLVPFATYMILLAGWRITWLALGSFVLFLALPLAIILIRDKPDDMGEVPDGETGDDSDASRASASLPGPLEVENWLNSYKTFPMWQLTGSYFVCGMTTMIISFHFVPFAEGKGFSPETAALAFGLMMGLNIVGVLGIGILSDKYGRKNMLGMTYAVRGLAYATLLLAPGSIGLWGFAIVAGMSWIATAPLTSSLTAEIYGLKNMGTLNGLATSAHQVGGATSVLMAGLMYDWLGSYTVPFAIAGSLLLLASITAFSIREKRYSSRYQPLIGSPMPIPSGDAD